MTKLTNKEIEQVVKDYLKENNIHFEKKDNLDEISIKTKQINDLYYVEVHTEYFKGFKYSDVYKEDIYSFEKDSYRFVIDKDGNEVVKIDKIARYGNSNTFVRCLDDKNILLPIQNNSQPNRANFNNNTEHIKIENGKATLVSVLNGRIFDQFLEAKKIIMDNWQLYDYEKGIILRDEFDKIFSEKIGQEYHPENLLFNLLRSWGIDSWLARKDFIDSVVNKMKHKHLILGYKILESEKENIRKSFHLLIFMDMNGNFVSGLYYVDNNELNIIDNVTSENINLIFQQLKGKLDSNVDDFMQPVENVEKDIFLQLLKEFEE